MQCFPFAKHYKAVKPSIEKLLLNFDLSAIFLPCTFSPLPHGKMLGHALPWVTNLFSSRIVSIIDTSSLSVREESIKLKLNICENWWKHSANLETNRHSICRKWKICIFAWRGGAYLRTLPHRHITFCVWEWEQPSQHCLSSCST